MGEKEKRVTRACSPKRDGIAGNPQKNRRTQGSSDLPAVRQATDQKTQAFKRPMIYCGTNPEAEPQYPPAELTQRV